MKNFIDKLIQLADGLDGLGLKKDADKLDQLVAKAAKGEDFGDLTSLFDEPIALEHEEDKGPGAEKVILDAPEVHTPLEEEEAPLSKEKSGPSRLDLLKRRHELMRLKKKLEHIEKEEEEALPGEAPVESPRPKLDLTSFEDEDDEEDVNEARDCMCPETFPSPCAKCLGEEVEEELDELNMILSKEDAALYDDPEEEISMADDDGIIGKLKDVLKGAPELAKQLLQLVKDNPELLELLAL